MKINKAEYHTTAVKPEQYPIHTSPEIAFLGRSNVGKSSLINAFLGRKSLARVSQHPGKTQTINFYTVNDGYFFLVDLPGYGFAKVSRETRGRWHKMIETYLAKRDNLLAIVQLIDLRHPPSAEDKQVFAWLKKFQENSIIICTKADKISRGKRQHHLKIIKEDLGVTAGDTILVSSSEDKTGIEEIRNFIGDLIS